MSAAPLMKGATATAVDGLQVAAGLLAFGAAKAALRKAIPADTNPHVVNAGFAVGGALLGAAMPKLRPVAMGMVAGAVASSVVTAFPEMPMGGAGHTKNRRDLSASERAALVAKIQEGAKRDRTLGTADPATLGASNNIEALTLNGDWYELQ